MTALNEEIILTHPFVIGELASGNLRNRKEILGLLKALPAAPLVEPHEILTFIESRNLMGQGLGYVDIHLLASVLLCNAKLWTHDKSLKVSAKSLSVIVSPH